MGSPSPLQRKQNAKDLRFWQMTSETMQSRSRRALFPQTAGCSAFLVFPPHRLGLLPGLWLAASLFSRGFAGGGLESRPAVLRCRRFPACGGFPLGFSCACSTRVHAALDAAWHPLWTLGARQFQTCFHQPQPGRWFLSSHHSCPPWFSRNERRL